MISSIKPVINKQKSKDMKISLNRSRKKFITTSFTQTFNDVAITFKAEGFKATRTIVNDQCNINGFILGFVSSYDSLKKVISITSQWIGKNELKPIDQLTFKITGINDRNVNVELLEANIERALPNSPMLFIIKDNRLCGCFTREQYSQWSKMPSVNLLNELEKLNPFTA